MVTIKNIEYIVYSHEMKQDKRESMSKLKMYPKIIGAVVNQLDGLTTIEDSKSLTEYMISNKLSILPIVESERSLELRFENSLNGIKKAELQVTMIPDNRIKYFLKDTGRDYTQIFNIYGKLNLPMFEVNKEFVSTFKDKVMIMLGKLHSNEKKELEKYSIDTLFSVACKVGYNKEVILNYLSENGTENQELQIKDVNGKVYNLTNIINYVIRDIPPSQLNEYGGDKLEQAYNYTKKFS